MPGSSIDLRAVHPEWFNHLLVNVSPKMREALAEVKIEKESGFNSEEAFLTFKDRWDWHDFSKTVKEKLSRLGITSEITLDIELIKKLCETVKHYTEYECLRRLSKEATMENWLPALILNSPKEKGPIIYDIDLEEFLVHFSKSFIEILNEKAVVLAAEYETDLEAFDASFNLSRKDVVKYIVSAFIEGFNAAAEKGAFKVQLPLMRESCSILELTNTLLSREYESAISAHAKAHNTAFEDPEAMFKEMLSSTFHEPKIAILLFLTRCQTASSPFRFEISNLRPMYERAKNENRLHHPETMRLIGINVLSVEGQACIRNQYKFEDTVDFLEQCVLEYKADLEEEDAPERIRALEKGFEFYSYLSEVFRKEARFLRQMV